VAANVRTKSFRELFEAIPAEVREIAAAAFRQFQADPDHPSLRRHQLKDTGRGNHRPGSFSVSVTKKYRAIYFVDGETNVWYWIGSHNDYDNYTGGK
jgi:hypothetical protein